MHRWSNVAILVFTTQARVQPLLPALALLTVARPLARPTPRPLVPLLLNMGAFLSISGTMKKRT